MQNNPYFKNLVSATFHVDNAADADRTVHISADADIQGDRVTGFSNGHATLPDIPGAVCDFGESNGSYLTVTFHNCPDAATRAATLTAIDTFTAAVRDSYATSVAKEDTQAETN